MAIKMIRKPSDIPNITNIDDIVPMRYAYGNQNGYVIGKGEELSSSNIGLTFTINSGRIVLQGVESDIDANGVSLEIDNVASTRYFSVYYKVNLATNEVDIETTYDTADYPQIPQGDDLTKNTIGTAYLELYRFTTLSNAISNVQKVVQAIKYTNKIIENYLTPIQIVTKEITEDLKEISVTNQITKTGLYMCNTNMNQCQIYISDLNTNYSSICGLSVYGDDFGTSSETYTIRYNPNSKRLECHENGVLVSKNTLHLSTVYLLELF